MIENIQLATKNEINEEMSALQKEFDAKKSELEGLTDEWAKKAKKIQDEMKELSEKYIFYKKEINKREGKII